MTYSDKVCPSRKILPFSQRPQRLLTLPANHCNCIWSESQLLWPDSPSGFILPSNNIYNASYPLDWISSLVPVHLAKCAKRGTRHFLVLSNVRLNEHAILRTQKLRAELARLNKEGLYTE